MENIQVHEVHMAVIDLGHLVSQGLCLTMLGQKLVQKAFPPIREAPVSWGQGWISLQTGG